MGRHGSPPEPQSWTATPKAATRQTKAYLAFLVVGSLVGFGAGVLASGPTDTPASADARPAATVTATSTITARPRATRTSTPTPSPRRVTVDDGTWTVGVDMPSGTYRAATVVDDTCYWRVSRSGSNGESIIANDFPGGGRPVVTVRKGQDFYSARCGTWVKR